MMVNNEFKRFILHIRIIKNSNELKVVGKNSICMKKHAVLYAFNF